MKIYLMNVTTNIAELLGTGTFFIIDYEQINKQIESKIQIGDPFLLLNLSRNPVCLSISWMLWQLNDIRESTQTSLSPRRTSIGI